MAYDELVLHPVCRKTPEGTDGTDGVTPNVSYGGYSVPKSPSFQDRRQSLKL
jgi:hypothetical protein